MKDKFLPFYAILLLIIACYGIKIVLIDSGVPFWVKPDIKDKIHVIGRKVIGYSKSTNLGKTKFIAQFSAGHHENKSYADDDFLSITVIAKKKANRWSVYFERQILLKEVPNDLQWQAPQEAYSYDLSKRVTYDDSSRTVSFNLDRRTYRYKLPYF